jgi:hypothetical protein
MPFQMGAAGPATDAIHVSEKETPVRIGVIEACRQTAKD